MLSAALRLAYVIVTPSLSLASGPEFFLHITDFVADASSGTVARQVNKNSGEISSTDTDCGSISTCKDRSAINDRGENSIGYSLNL